MELIERLLKDDKKLVEKLLAEEYSFEAEIEELLSLGYNFEKGISFQQDYKVAKKIYEKCASYDYPKAFNNLGWLYQNGFGVKKDLKKAEEYYTKAFNLGESIAAVNIGNIYEFNEKKLSKIDWKTAKKWYLRGALLGDEKAAFNYANCLHYGYGGPKDHETALSVYRRLAGVLKGCYWYVGYYYQNGFAVKKDIKTAISYYTKGIEEEKDSYCYLSLGNLAIEGKLGNKKKDPKLAVMLYLNAIYYGDTYAYDSIAYMFESGDATGKKDMDSAIAWYQLGANNGEKLCVDKLKKLGIKLNNDIEKISDDCDKSLHENSLVDESTRIFSDGIKLPLEESDL